eukprot:6218293-Prorocentrum_lima.AAC.1
MTSSLVGSEMCIRDRLLALAELPVRMAWATQRSKKDQKRLRKQTVTFSPVSYTHLTLPTICSV